jgi:hypothetical protein
MIFRSDPRPSEGGHWYARDGSAVYELPRADGKGKRPVTLRDARKMGLVPGVSGVLNCAAKDALTRWKVRQGILAALTLPRLPDELDDSFIERVLTDSGEQARKAADRGSAIHAAIQGHYEGKPPSEDMWPFVKAVQLEVGLRFGDVCAWIPEASFAHPAGYGGKCDLHATIAINTVIDFKTKEFSQKDLDDGKQLAWDDHCIQLAAYRQGLGIPGARCANVFVSVNNPGLVTISEWTEQELQRGWKMFQGLLHYWKANRNYDSAFEREAVAA